MKIAILCALFLTIGAAAGSAVTGYFVDRFHKRNYAILFAGELGGAAMQAEFIKFGEVTTVLETLEKSIPDRLIAIHENDLLRDAPAADSAMMATKRFYVCTGTTIPTEIVKILEPVRLPENACGPQR